MVRSFDAVIARDDRTFLSGLVSDVVYRPAAVHRFELSISGFYLASQRALYPKTWKRSILYMPFVMAVGIGLSVRNAKAVLEAVFGVQSEFARTPKFNIEGQSGTWRKKSYRNRAGWMPYLEIALGIYFAMTIVYAIQNENYATAPFLFLFVWGFLYTGVMSIAQGWIDRIRFGVAARRCIDRKLGPRLRARLGFSYQLSFKSSLK